MPGGVGTVVVPTLARVRVCRHLLLATRAPVMPPVLCFESLKFCRIISLLLYLLLYSQSSLYFLPGL